MPLNNVGKFEGAGVDLTVAGDKALAPLEEGLVCSCAYKFLSNKNIKFLRHFKIAGKGGHVELFINRVIAYRVSNYGSYTFESGLALLMYYIVHT